MKTNTKIVATLGVVAGLGVASIPAFSYAANVSGDVQIDTEVESSLAMRIHSNADQTCSGDPEVCTDAYGFIGYNPATAQGSTDPAATASGVASQATGLSLSSNQADTTTLYSNISVRSNTGKFKLEVADADTDTAMRNESGSTTENQYIPAGITTTEENGETVINPGVAGWALKGGDIASWTAITASDASPLTVKALDTNTTNPLAYSSDITVNYAVSSGLTKTDTYSDVITYTATALDSDYSLGPTLDDISTMQEMNPEIVANAKVGASKTLTDTRGGSYTVAKLADGNIWMTQDLKLGGDSALTLTPADSDVSSDFTLAAENTGTWCTSGDASCINQSLMIKTGAPNGYLYNWYAATAGTGVYGASAHQNASASICPKGWKLPTGGSDGQFVGLDRAYGGDGSNRSDAAAQQEKFMASPLSFNHTGYRYGDSIYYPSDNAVYWARTNLSESYAYFLNFISDWSGIFNPGGYNPKYYGYAVRCVAAS